MTFNVEYFILTALPMVLFNEWTHNLEYTYGRVLHLRGTLCQMFSGRIVACGRRRLRGGRHSGRGNTAWRGKGHDRIGSLGNAASKWRQPTWRSVVKHRQRHKMQWPTGICVGPRGQCKEHLKLYATCAWFTSYSLVNERQDWSTENFIS